MFVCVSVWVDGCVGVFAFMYLIVSVCVCLSVCLSVFSWLYMYVCVSASPYPILCLFVNLCDQISVFSVYVWYSHLYI